jgi:putative ABC transport system permease protein
MNIALDFRYALRLLRRSWGYSLMCASVVALSVGLAIWTYSMIYVQILKPLGFPNSERWFSVQIAADATTAARPSVDAFTYQELLKRNRTSDYLGAFATRVVVLSEGQASVSLRASAISPRLITATRVPPRLGRIFEEADSKPGAAAVAILSFDTWQNYFAADPLVVGRMTRIDTAPVQIVGVMPKDFYAFQDSEVWLPLQLGPVARPRDSALTLSPLIVLDSGQSLQSIVREMQTVVRDVNREYPDVFKSSRHVAVFPALRMYTHTVAPLAAMLALMAAAVLLLGCMNISMVFFARMLERRRELALRTALGASRTRLLRQSLLETALVLLVGLAAGFGLAVLGIRWTQGLSNFLSQTLAAGRLSNSVVVRPTDLLVAVIAATVMWLLSTLIPAWRVTKLDASAVLAGSGKGSSMRGSNKTVSFLVGLQVVVSCLVLVVCGNVVFALRKEVGRPSGLDTTNVLLSATPTVFDARHSAPSDRLRYWEDLTAAVQSKLPGSVVAFTTATPTRPVSTPAVVESRHTTENQGLLTVPVSVVSDDYFKLLGIRLRSGRLFDSTDSSTSLNVAVVDEEMAARYWPGQSAMGQRVRLNPATDSAWLTVVGVVSSVVGRPYHNEDIGIIYRPLRQALPDAFQLLVRTPNSVGQTRVVLRAAAFSVDRDLPLHNLQTLNDYLTALNLSYTALVPVIGVVALITALLAASGLFGLISRTVAQRTQEVGIRRALGATSLRATSMFIRQGAWYLAVAIAGVGIGVMIVPLLSATFTNILESAVAVTLGVVFLMALVIASASYLPSRRAVALEPGDALRYE